MQYLVDTGVWLRLFDRTDPEHVNATRETSPRSHNHNHPARPIVEMAAPAATGFRQCFSRTTQQLAIRTQAHTSLRLLPQSWQGIPAAIERPKVDRPSLSLGRPRFHPRLHFRQNSVGGSGAKCEKLVDASSNCSRQTPPSAHDERTSSQTNKADCRRLGNRSKRPVGDCPEHPMRLVRVIAVVAIDVEPQCYFNELGKKRA